MPRLIDVDEAYKILTDYYNHRTETQHEALKEALSKVPTVDAVEVVRCKDCEFYTEDEKWCRWLGLIGAFNEDGFCSHGELDVWSHVLSKTDGEREEDGNT